MRAAADLCNRWGDEMSGRRFLPALRSPDVVGGGGSVVRRAGAAAARGMRRPRLRRMCISRRCIHGGGRCEIPSSQGRLSTVFIGSIFTVLSYLYKGGPDAETERCSSIQRGGVRVLFCCFVFLFFFKVFQQVNGGRPR